jgi:hypothetical protein
MGGILMKILMVRMVALWVIALTAGMDVIICENEAEYNAIEAVIHAGRIEDGAVEERWSDPIIHPVSGDYAIPVEDHILKYLTQSQIERVEDLPESWVPEVVSD